ncbi:TRAP transporter substrate-binding protein [Gymnodinialimonas ceratoperidinii]|uniref:TRAP transporter substrate-binding protein n=1 Tax=Gymnodinialimonas ceratoperidinii TaxID=2856823 RepID=A0A8F6TT49_9RHOB|nr:TRAP transporter substrate-binding protein [Gymnodinialimonas ceratoperidinii]QXT38205.1 TRAP transporter substrate-binding protein [Gymnodinialimonas ceratoperidinii]
MSGPVRITLAGYQGPDSVHTRGLEAFRDALTAAVGDRVEVILRPNVGPDGIKTEALPGLVEAGELDACYIASSYLAGRVRELSLFDMPFSAPDRHRALALVDGPLGARFGSALAAATGLTLLGVWDNGLRHMATARQPLHDPSECDGMVLRTLPNDDHQAAFRALGFRPLVIDAKDLTQAVCDGEVDAQENPLTNTYNFNLHGRLPVITLTGHLMGIALFVFNKDRFAALPEDLRQAISAAAAEATRAQRALAESEDEHCARALRDDGATLVVLTDAQRAAWREAAAPHTERARAQHDPELLALFDAETGTDDKAPDPTPEPATALLNTRGEM